MSNNNLLKTNVNSDYFKIFELYKVIIEENRHQHHVWVDNFRIILSSNSILLAGAFAILTIFSKADKAISNFSYLPLLLIFISIIGIVVSLVGIQIILRTKAITNLRNHEIRYIENKMKDYGVTVFPFEEGALILGITKDTFIKNIENYPYQLGPLYLNLFSGSAGYYILSALFISAYIVIFILTVLIVRVGAY